MLKENIDNIEKYIKTHTERSSDDQAAVSFLKNSLKSGGKINSDFAENDKWPNIDGTFEFVYNPEISRRPMQNFIVQIKGTHQCHVRDGVVCYQLKSLAFPAWIYKEVTLDPGILFVVLNPNTRGQERVFWKYISADFLSSIDFSKDSKLIKFCLKEEIKYTDESIDEFCEKLYHISNHHSFVKNLENRNYSEKDVKKIIMNCNQEIVRCIDELDIMNTTRDDVSNRMLRYLDDICRSALLLNAINIGFENSNLRVAWEKALLNKQTRYLCVFLKGLRYIGGRIPEYGQSERLMLKYYNFLWQIRDFLFNIFHMNVLSNLEKFPLDIDEIDYEYHATLATVIESINLKPKTVRISRFYVQKRIPFFIGNKRYYEITLQLSGKFATKYNRITVYSKDSIDTGYSIQIAYTELAIDLWGISSNIKFVTNWKVSVNPTCINKLGKILQMPIKLSTNYGEYQALMTFLTETGINLLDFIDLGNDQFESCLDKIYSSTNTNQFKEILIELHNNYTKNSTILGRYTIRYLILHLKEDSLEDVLPKQYNPKILNPALLLSTSCFPFEKNPYIANLVGRKTTSINQLIDMQNITGIELYSKCHPFVLLKCLVNNTREIYFTMVDIANRDKINNFNSSLDRWNRLNGDMILQQGDLVYIESFERKTIQLIKKFLDYSTRGNKGQIELNNEFLKDKNVEIDDILKYNAIKNIFTDSRLALVYGAAGTGKTKLINFISNLMYNKRKLFLTKTHTTLQNLKRKIENPGLNADFISIDRFTKKIELQDYDVIFVDECSIIDNEVMLKFVNKISENTFVVLAGDIFQIESINFGNWFFYAKDIIKTNGANIELTNTWRTKDETLKSLWREVRTKSSLITEMLSMDGEFSKDIGAEIFDKSEDDEVVLCLNYDGKFGLNNMNQYFQSTNNQEAIYWQEWIYKVGDPIIFNDTKRFELLYNNLKGRIVGISKTDEQIVFTIDADLILTEADCRNEKIKFIDIFGNVTRISFIVNAYEDYDEENEVDKMSSVVPFQIAYAISIHKAQGLEYDSVKVIIPKSNSERITHDIFYTAITRAKKKLKIFWSSETMRDIISEFTIDESISKSLEIIKLKL